jgi:hypothetical protein
LVWKYGLGLAHSAHYDGQVVIGDQILSVNLGPSRFYSMDPSNPSMINWHHSCSIAGHCN